MSLTIKNAKLVLNGKDVIRHIVIRRGKIEKISSAWENWFGNSSRVIDAEEKYVMPGVIDMHVALYDYSSPENILRETWLTGSRAAVKGGVTTMIVDPEGAPSTTLLMHLKKRRELAKESVVNYGFHFGAEKENGFSVEKAKGIASSVVKKKSEMPEKEGVISVSAQSPDVEKIVRKMKETGGKVYVYGVRTRDELEKLWKKKGKNMYIGLDPEVLFSDDSGLKKSDEKYFWDAIEDGTIDILSSQHMPVWRGDVFDESEGSSENKRKKKVKRNERKKEMGRGRGPGLETFLPLLLESVVKGKLSLVNAVRLTSRNPALLLGLLDKGLLREGSDADLVIVDLKEKKVVEEGGLITRCGWSKYTGRKIVGWPILTLVNGKIIYEKEKEQQITHLYAPEVDYSEKEIVV